jgi:two-component system, OmpR family, response regulator
MLAGNGRQSLRILVVEDEVKLAASVKRGLEVEGYAVDVLHDGLAARRRLAARGEADPLYDLLLLDVMLPGMNGFALCRDLRDRGLTLPVLMLTARDATPDKVTGLDSGADDYLVKPFAFEELLARIRTLLRRPRQTLPPRLSVAGLELDPASHEVLRDGEHVELSTREFSLLELFMRHPGQVLSRDRILDNVWDEEFDSFSNIVDVYVARLRRKLDSPGRPSRFQTRRGAGYILRAAPAERGTSRSGQESSPSKGKAGG